ncbi:MAG: DNA/RNA non-specific endonuclease [Pseudomonadota bacterium]
MARRHTAVRVAALLYLLRRHPLLLLAMAVLTAGWYGYEVLHARPAMAWQGVPAAIDWRALTWTRVLRNDAFLVGWSDLRGNPLWVEYRLQPVPADAPFYRRPERFNRDWRALNSIGHDDYSGSGYDRGHLAPNYAISRLYGPTAQQQTFLMTNITPQRPRLNQKVWQRLEEAEIDFFAPRAKELWVITGPIFDADIQRLAGSARVEIPDAFFKIYAAPGRGAAPPRLLAFVVPQSVRGDEPLDYFVTSVDRVEELTGFDFFPALDPAQQSRLEAAIDAAAWQLEAVARRPGRY